MKCDELRVVRVLGAPERYNKEEVDEAIKELKEEVNNLLMQNMELCQALQVMYSAEEYTILQDENAELKEENLNLKTKNVELQSFYDLHGNVDNYIDKLKAENKLLKEHIANGDVSRITWIDEVIELKQKLEDVQASMYADVVDANMKIRRLQRALYKACANWAHEKDDRYYLKYVCISDDARIQYERWRKMERKCQAKAEEYK